MRIVNLVSGGLDSSLIAILLKEQGLTQFPLFINYGQKAYSQEWEACKQVHILHSLPIPVKFDFAGFGNIIKTGLTSDQHPTSVDAFTPCRNLLFIVLAASYAHQIDASAISIGLLTEKNSIFPDQRNEFLKSAKHVIKESLGHEIEIVTPLFQFTKADVQQLSASKGLTGTYSCHEGGLNPCGKCISCKEFQQMEV